MHLAEQLALLTTEAVNDRTREIDLMSTRDAVGLLHDEDRVVADAVGRELDPIARAVDLVVEMMNNGGGLIYVGAGTSGRLGILDASEMPPTFGVPPTLVRGIIAGGRDAVFASIEGAEDDAMAGKQALAQELAAGTKAVVCGLSASGRTPFVLGALEEASRQGMPTVLVSTNTGDVVRAFAPYVDVFICPHVGPEPIAGSTRMKSGTAQKMVLNMITTASMVRLGKTFGNVMVDLQLTNEKLRERARRIVMSLAGVDAATAGMCIDQAEGNVKTAIVMARFACTKQEALERLARAGGIIRTALTI